MQPDWRATTDGRLVHQPAGQWDVLHKPGKRGFVLILLALMWWRMATSVPEPNWTAAIDDVGWILTSLLADARQSQPKDVPADPAKKVMPRPKRKAAPDANDEAAELERARPSKRKALRNTHDGTLEQSTPQPKRKGAREARNDTAKPGPAQSTRSRTTVGDRSHKKTGGSRK